MAGASGIGASFKLVSHAVEPEPNPASYFADLAASTDWDGDGDDTIIYHLRSRIIRRQDPANPSVSLPRFESVARPLSVPAEGTEFFIPLSILNQTVVSPQNGSALLQLPPEVLTLVLEQVKIPYFQVCFALTCKAMGRVASSKGVLSPWRGYRDKDGLFRLLQRNHYIPQRLRLCRACFRFLPWNDNYWTLKMESPEFDDMKGNWTDILNWFDPKSYLQHRCPHCCNEGYTSYIAESSYAEDTENKGADDRRLMCPQLHRRMGRP
ncbi:hypothetical protein ABEF92_007865 [Exophiala dermatitidis]|uniref:F-box domain-containing protein n=1 Tax=Exophiala dermatitidis (strain ATCC 34100 / CBS 525.76 / NIH/UT8656) TaxID=858893 RepID=H6BNH4_EXODN|nr:uncharacterized protein HMPREF1120_00565 [Exophiala dermatitidis NIH/UT8656]EHY52351.1 hypothetical protein HMPREF1120_00565 [Exophiala dermatitidis NIH/UT8656]